jgi:Transcription factor Tfb4
MDKDDSSQYTKIVKGIFAAKKMNVTIDALILNETST